MIRGKKVGLSCGVCFIILLVFVSQSSALFARDIRKAKGFISAGIYTRAISLLETAVLEKPTNAEAHFLLGISYIYNGNVRHANDVFENAVMLNRDYGIDIGREYKKAADKAFIRADLRSACSFFQKAAAYDPEIGKGAGYSLFTTVGNKTGNAEYYERCTIDPEGSSQKKQQTELGTLIFSAQELAKQESVDLQKDTSEHVQDEGVNRSSEDYSMNVVFEKNYTFDDAFDKKYGQIKTIRFGQDDVRVGDKIEVVTRLKNGGYFKGKEIGIWNGDMNNLKWERTKNGYYSEKVKKTQKGSFTISLSKRRDVRVLVRVERIIIRKADVALAGT